MSTIYESSLKDLPKIRRDIKKRWLAALRSGEYKQGQGALRTDDDRFCCLGVLCDIVKDELKLAWKPALGGRQDFGRSGGYMPPPEVDHHVVVEVGDWGALTERNDGVADFNGNPSGRQTFKQIANLIERHC